MSVEKPDFAAPITDERTYVTELVRHIIDEAPRRQATSEDEAQALDIMRDIFDGQGLNVSEHPFYFNDSLYANLALHFGMSVLGTAVSGVAPLAGFGMHLLSGTSYWAESTRKAYLLRRLLPFKPSRNILGTLPAEGEPRLRIVLGAHVDAAFTGWLFSPFLVGMTKTTGKPGFLQKSLQLANRSQFALAGFDLARAILGPVAAPLRPVEWLLTMPSLIALVLNTQLLLQNEIVPGAADDLSGIVALPPLAARLAPKKPKDVEIVFAAFGCEEASLGGGDALARQMEGVWEKDKTIVVMLDTLTNGELRYLDPEGEVVPTPVPRWLAYVTDYLANAEPRYAEVKPFEPPVGGSDAAAFLAHGYDAICLSCIDPELGSCRHYHQSTDNLENLDVDQLLFGIEFTEELVHAIISERLGAHSK